MLNQSQLVWRCRRGVRELDVLFTRYLESQYPSLSKDKQLNFQALLEVQDPTIMDWLFSKTEPDSDFSELIVTLQAFAGLQKSL